MSKLFQICLLIILFSCSYENDVIVEGFYFNDMHDSGIFLINDTSQFLQLENTSLIDSLMKYECCRSTLTHLHTKFGSHIAKVKGDLYTNYTEIPFKKFITKEVLSFKLISVKDSKIDTIQLYPKKF